MTKIEAIKLMKTGVKITHENFSSEEWMTFKENKILFEDGVICSPEQFWSFRTNKTWDSGYSIFKD